MASGCIAMMAVLAFLSQVVLWELVRAGLVWTRGAAPDGVLQAQAVVENSTEECSITGPLICDSAEKEQEHLSLLQLQPAMAKGKPRAIPDRLVLNHKINFLKMPDTGADLTASLLETSHNWVNMTHWVRLMNLNIDFYGFKDVEFLDNDGCFRAIERVHSVFLADKARRFVNNGDGQSGAYASDICRLAQLYEHGGYYFDNDMPAVRDVRALIPRETSFVSCIGTNNGNMFNSFIGVAPRHPIIKLAMDFCVNPKHDGFLGPNTLMKAWYTWNRWGGCKKGECAWRRGPHNHTAANQTQYQQSYIFEFLDAHDLWRASYQKSRPDLAKTMYQKNVDKGLVKMGDQRNILTELGVQARSGFQVDGNFIGDALTGEIVFWSQVHP